MEPGASAVGPGSFPDDTIYAVGGENGLPVSPFVSSLEAYRPDADRWNPRKPMTFGRGQ